jgi:hypothetical protein
VNSLKLAKNSWIHPPFIDFCYSSQPKGPKRAEPEIGRSTKMLDSKAFCWGIGDYLERTLIEVGTWSGSGHMTLSGTEGMTLSILKGKAKADA